MNLQRIKHTLLRLTAEEKVIGTSALVTMVGVFLPWYSVVMNFDKKNLMETGFSGDLGVIGFVIFLMAIITATVLVAENMHLPIPQFGYKRDQILFFFLGQSFFLTLLTMAIYTKRGLEFTDASIRFGAYTVLIASFFGALSAFALIQKTKRGEVEKFFNNDDMEDEEEFEEAPARGHQEEDVAEDDPEPMFFEEDAQSMPDPELEVEQEQKFNNYIPEDDMIEDVEEIPMKDLGNQGDYFKRDAGVNHEAQSKDIKEGKSRGMNFYDDK